MDDVDEEIVPGVTKIRKAFDAQRNGKSKDRKNAWDQIVRRLRGLDTKIAQYRDGARFVRAGELRAGREGLNLKCTRPEMLPTNEGLRHPYRLTKHLNGECPH